MSVPSRDIIGFLTASRIPNLIIIAYTQFATAFFLLEIDLEQILTFNFGLLVLSTMMIGAGGYIINDYFDQKIDMINRPTQVVVGPSLRRRLAIISHVVLSITAIIIGFYINPIVGVIHIFSSGALWTYSGAIKKILLLSTLTLSFLTILTILIVAAFYREISVVASIYALFGCTAIFIRETLKDIVSAKGEKVFGVQSVPIVWGIRGAKLVIYLAAIAGISLLSLYLIAVPNWHVRFFFALLIPFILWFLFEITRADQKQEFKRLINLIDLMIISGLVSMSLV